MPLAKVHYGSDPGVESSDGDILPLSLVFSEIPIIALDLKNNKVGRNMLQE